MQQDGLHQLVERVRQGSLSRRDVMARLAALGLGPAVSSVLLPARAMAQTEPVYRPTRRGGGGLLRVLMWQGPTLLNPHFAVGTKDADGARVFYEPLARWDNDGELRPVLAAEVPSLGNGGVARDGRSVTWRLKPGVKWHDGQPFTADDVLFNAAYASDPATAATTSGSWRHLKLVKVDSLTVRVEYPEPSPFWATPYCIGSLIPRHVFAPFSGAASREAPANNRPVGTGPYRIAEFKPGDLLTGTLNPDYHAANRPHFDRIEIKGGGDAVSAARAVLQTGEFDFGWTLQVEDDLLKRLETGGKGQVHFAAGGTMEFIQLNFSDPDTEVDGERSHPDTRHPLLRDPAVRQALALCVDRAGIQAHIYGRTAVSTANIVHNPARFRSPNLKPEFNPDKAAAVLEAAGWKKAGDGVRQKDGRRLKLLFQTSVNGARQKAQTVIKSACQRAGIDLELKAVTSAVFFSGDAGNPDTLSRFQADMQMFSSTMGPPDPGRFMDRCASWEVARKANKWQGRNAMRWRSDEYDRLYQAAAAELDPARRATLFIRMNDLVCGDGYLIPLMFRYAVSATANRLVAPTSGWDNGMSVLADWHRLG
ncbi:MAG: peptide ABC transporter substrate-binding protein [Aquabacterium sp.]